MIAAYLNTVHHMTRKRHDSALGQIGVSNIFECKWDIYTMNGTYIDSNGQDNLV